VITDNTLCPVIPFAHLYLVVPSRSIPLIGYPTTICMHHQLSDTGFGQSVASPVQGVSGGAGTNVSGKRYSVQFPCPQLKARLLTKHTQDTRSKGFQPSYL
jgi:hypothetical protein